MARATRCPTSLGSRNRRRGGAPAARSTSSSFSPHKRAEVQKWAAANNVELVFLPTYSSWLNWIESEFAALRYFALNGTDHRSHNEQDTAIGAYICWRNQHARPKREFAVNSTIRRPDYLPNVA
ncbi:transposase [Nocardia fusca]|uniref:Transposase n=1 Tax=Nocardia fusca TaxID=941183 RepID=A0ABV3FF48_9NOCA